MKRESPERRMVRTSGLLNSMRIRSSFFCSQIWPDSLEVSSTTAVYLIWSMFPERVWKSRAELSMRASTESAVHFWGDCAARVCATMSSAGKIAQRKKPGLLVKGSPVQCKFEWNATLTNRSTHNWTHREGWALPEKGGLD